MRKIITWHSPKKYQSGWESYSGSNPAKLPKPKAKYCKFLKGPHQFGEWIQFKFPWKSEKPSGMWERFCIKCNKKDYWSAPWLKERDYEPDPDARPPGYKED